MPANPASTRAKVIAAFDADGFDVDPRSDVFQLGNHLGIRASHRTATSFGDGKKKRAYYVEGDPHSIGWLLGRMTETRVARMTDKFLVNVVPDFIDPGLPDCVRVVLGKFILKVVRYLAKQAKGDVPQIYLDEMDGLVAGCKAANPQTKVRRKDLLALNLGIDCLLPVVFKLDQIIDLLREHQREAVEEFIAESADLGGLALPASADLFDPQPEWFRLPLMCNAFSICGEPTGDNHYFGRDFMFPNADTFQDVAALVVCNPAPVEGVESVPFVSMTAPGLLGSVAAMNLGNQEGKGGLGMGVNLVAGGNCNPLRPGIRLYHGPEEMCHREPLRLLLRRLGAHQPEQLRVSNLLVPPVSATAS